MDKSDPRTILTELDDLTDLRHWANTTPADWPVGITRMAGHCPVISFLREAYEPHVMFSYVGAGSIGWWEDNPTYGKKLEGIDTPKNIKQVVKRVDRLHEGKKPVYPHELIQVIDEVRAENAEKEKVQE